MPIYNIHLTTPLRSTFRTEQIAGLFDLALGDVAKERLAHTLTAELPSLDEDWTIGAIVGPSGSGKTTLARAAYGDAVYQPSAWPEDVAIIDCLEGSEVRVQGSGDNAGLNPEPRTLTPLKHLLRVLTAVGLSSPPSWLKPYRVLSTGERFRADLARAILGIGSRVSGVGQSHPTPDSRPPTPGLLVFDEFTSALDRTNACTASFALAKFLRRTDRSESRGQRSEVREQMSEVGGQRSEQSSALTSDLRSLTSLRFVALSCHTDFLPWLAPDWVLDLGVDPPQLARGSLRRPPLRLAVRRVPQKLWPRFARHHYLTGGLSAAATCYAAFVASNSVARDPVARDSVAGVPSRSDGLRPIAFCAVVATLGWKRTKRITRLVVLPEYQGLGIGPRLAETVAAAQAAAGNRVTITASHPAILAWCSRSPRWRYAGVKKSGSTRQQLAHRTIRSSAGRAVASFEFVQ